MRDRLYFFVYAILHLASGVFVSSLTVPGQPRATIAGGKPLLKGRSKPASARFLESASSGLPSCKCSWPEIGADGVAEEQTCPPPGVKCEMCMQAVYHMKFQGSAQDICGNFEQEQENYGFCSAMAEEIEQVEKEVLKISEALARKYGPGYGASREVCQTLNCCV